MSTYKTALEQVLDARGSARKGLTVEISTTAKVRPQTREYDPHPKHYIRINNSNVRGEDVVQLLAHQMGHALQQRDGYFGRMSNLDARQKMLQKLEKKKKGFDYRRHYKYLKSFLKMQYNREKRAYQILKNGKTASKYIDFAKFINSANNYMMMIKYRFETGKFLYGVDCLELRPTIKDRFMTDRQLVKPINYQQASFIWWVYESKTKFDQFTYRS